MIVNENDASSTRRDGRLKDFTGVDQDHIESSVGNFLDANQASPRIEQNHVKSLDNRLTKVFAKHVRDYFRTIQHRRVGSKLPRHALGKGESALQGNSFIPADAAHLLQFGQRRPCELFERPELFDQLFAKLESRYPFRTRPQQDGKQFGVLETFSPICNQAFARALLLRPVFDWDVRFYSQLAIKHRFSVQGIQCKNLRTP